MGFNQLTMWVQWWDSYEKGDGVLGFIIAKNSVIGRKSTVIMIPAW
jgi:hypothetical protein